MEYLHIGQGMRVVAGEDVESAVSKTPLPSELEEPGAEPAPPLLDPQDPDARDELKAWNEAHFDRQFESLTARLRGQKIEIEIDETAKEFLCDPFWTETTLDRALAQLIEQPLMDKLEAGEFHPGDRVQVQKYADHLEFKKAEGGER